MGKFSPIEVIIEAEQNTKGTTSCGHARVDIGDWVVTWLDGAKSVYKDAKFRASFKPVDGDARRELFPSGKARGHLPS